MPFLDFAIRKSETFLRPGSVGFCTGFESTFSGAGFCDGFESAFLGFAVFS